MIFFLILYLIINILVCVIKSAGMLKQILEKKLVKKSIKIKHPDLETDKIENIDTKVKIGI